MDEIATIVQGELERMALVALTVQGILSDEDGERMAGFAQVVGAGAAHGIGDFADVGLNVVGLLAAHDRGKAETLLMLIKLHAQTHKCGEQG